MHCECMDPFVHFTFFPFQSTFSCPLAEFLLLHPQQLRQVAVQILCYDNAAIRVIMQQFGLTVIIVLADFNNALLNQRAFEALFPLY